MRGGEREPGISGPGGGPRGGWCAVRLCGMRTRVLLSSGWWSADAGAGLDGVQRLGVGGGHQAELDEVGSPEDDFAADMVAWTKSKVRDAVGDGAFEAAYEAGREATG